MLLTVLFAYTSCLFKQAAWSNERMTLNSTRDQPHNLAFLSVPDSRFRFSSERVFVQACRRPGGCFVTTCSQSGAGLTACILHFRQWGAGSCHRCMRVKLCAIKYPYGNSWQCCEIRVANHQLVFHTCEKILSAHLSKQLVLIMQLCDNLWTWNSCRCQQIPAQHSVLVAHCSAVQGVAGPRRCVKAWSMAHS
jgi:hypothetical protein